MSDQSEWTLRLETPAETRFLHVVRLAASGAAAEAGLDAEQVDDVKIAVDELCSIAIDGADGSATLTLRFAATDRGLVVEAEGPPTEGLPVDELAHAILDATLDELQLGPDGPAGGFRLVKHRGVG